MVKTVNMNLEIMLLPDDEMSNEFNQNIGNRRFIWNNTLELYNTYYRSGKDYGYSISPTDNIFNGILRVLKRSYSFLREGESTSQQQTVRDLRKAFENFFKGKSKFPKRKNKKYTKQTFRIQEINNNVRVTNRRIRLAKLKFCHYKTSSKYRHLLKSSKINNVTVKKENGLYYAVVNIETTVDELSKKNKNVGIDLGLKSLATLSTGEKIANLDLSREEAQIKKYQKKLSRQKKGSKNYQKTQSKLHKWRRRKNNKQKDTYNKLSKYIVKNFDIIAMEYLNIHGMFQNDKWSSKLQRISLYKLVNMIKYKADWYGRKFVQIGRFFPSSKKCHICDYIYEGLTLDMREWKCPACGTTHDRDHNAAINILNEGLRLLSLKENNK